MIRFKIFLSHLKHQYSVFLIITLFILCCLLILNHFKHGIFKRFTGDYDPVIAGCCIAFFGFVFLFFLITKAELSIYNRACQKRTLRLLSLLIPILLITLLIDLNIVYPEDMNIQFPESMLFYLVIAFFVEIIFHLMPLSLLLIFLTILFKNKNRNLLLWIAIFSISLLEPSYQVFYMEAYPIWASVLLWTNLYLFNLVQLYVFWRCDFVSMYVFRLVYYAVWHIAWGHFRLELLF